MANSRPFLDFLREQRNGVLHDELSDALQDCVASVSTEGGTAKLTLTITIKPSGTGQGAVMTTDDIKTTVPKPTKGGSIFFISPENNLVREDPRQHKLELNQLKPVGPLRELA